MTSDGHDTGRSGNNADLPELDPAEEEVLRHSLERQAGQHTGTLRWEDVTGRRRPMRAIAGPRLPLLVAAVALVIVVGAVAIAVAARRPAVSSPPAENTAAVGTAVQQTASTPSAPSTVEGSNTVVATSSAGATGTPSERVSDSGEVVSSGPGFPASSLAPSTLKTNPADYPASFVSVMWAKNDDLLLVTTFGSGSLWCARRVISIEQTGPHSVNLILSGTDDVIGTHTGPIVWACTDDLRPYTSVVRLPDGLTPDHPLDVSVIGPTIHLPARDK